MADDVGGAASGDDASYWVDSSGHVRTTAFEIDVAGMRALHIKGDSWFGLESSSCFIGGADHGSLAEYAQFLSANRFNAVRIPLAMSELLPGATGACLNSAAYKEHNAAFAGLGYVETLRAFVKLLGEQNARHRG